MPEHLYKEVLRFLDLIRRKDYYNVNAQAEFLIKYIKAIRAQWNKYSEMLNILNEIQQKLETVQEISDPRKISDAILNKEYSHLISVPPEKFTSYFEEHIKDNVNTLLGAIIQDVERAKKFEESLKIEETA